MKIATILLFSACFTASAGGFAQNVTLSVNNVNIEKVFKEIKKQTGYVFFYDASVLQGAKPVSIHVKNKSVEEVLKESLEAQPLDFSIERKTITIFKKTGYPVNATRVNNESPVAIPASIINGAVKDADGNPLANVSVIVKGTQKGASTGKDGSFSIDANVGDVLEFSMVGYQKKSITVGQSKSLAVVMEIEALIGDEVMVIGYGTAKKGDLTGAVATVSSKAFLDQPSSSVNSVLSGRAPGVSVRRMNGAPGEGPTIRIRGANSLYGGNDPLIVVDGNYASMPDMYDIQSIEILKDASATAIYGSRGANGVILVTTKRGSNKKPTLSLYSNLSFDKIPKHYDLMDAYEFAEFNNRVGAYPFTDEEIAGFKTNKGTNWQNEIFQTGVSQAYKAVISGGSENVRYYVSPDYKKATGTIKSTQAGSYALTSKVDMDLSKSITVQVEAHLGRNDNVNPQLAQGGSKTSIPIMGAMIWSPTEPVYEADGKFNRLGIGTGTMLNPALMTTIQEMNYRNFGTGVLNFKARIFEGLEFNAKGNISYSTGGNREFESKDYNGVNAKASQSSYESKSWLLNAFLSYAKTVAQSHNLSVMAGFEETKNNSQSLSGTANILPLESAGWYNLGLATPNISVGSDYSNSALRSYFGRLNYNYDARYYLTANFRADGSSRFKGSNQFSYFPSFSAAWRLSNEQFMKDQTVFQNIKIRGGWGITGNQAIGNYATYTTLGSRGFYWGGVQQAGYYARVGGNPDLKWESTKQLNIGLDIVTLSGRLALSLDYYKKKTEDLLAPTFVAAYNGGDSEYGENSVISNVGSVQNTGFEFSINYDVLQSGAFTYDVNLNGSFNRNKVLDLGDQTVIYGETYASGLSAISPFALIPGQPIGTIYGLKYLGIWQEKEAAEAAKYQQQPGDYKYEDLNKDYNYGSADNQVIGKTNPSFTWGFNNHFSYKNFDLNILFEGVHGRDVLNWSYMIAAERIDFKQLFTLSEGRNRWTEDNPDAKFARIGNSNKLTPNSSQYIEDGSYVKLRNISLSYRIPRKITSFADIKVSVSAQNMLTLSKYLGYDPEISSSAGDDVNSGMDWFAYPNPKSMSVGIAVTF